MSSPTPIHDMVHHHTSTTSTPGVSHDTALSGGTGLLPTPFAFLAHNMVLDLLLVCLLVKVVHPWGAL